MVWLSDRHVSADQPTSSGVLARFATTGIYLVRGVPRELQRAARARAVSEGTSLRRVLLRALRDYAAGTWTPQPDDAALSPGTTAIKPAVPAPPG